MIKNRNRFQSIYLNDLDINDNNKALIDYFKSKLNKDTIEKFINNCENVFIIGNVGVGKSYIVNAFLNDLEKIIVDDEKPTTDYDTTNKTWKTKIIKRPLNTVYINIYKLIENLRVKYNGLDIDDNLFTCDLLVIDEAGVQFGTDNERQTLFELIEYRYNYYKPTIIISNLDFENTKTQRGLKSILGYRIMDRLKDNSQTFYLKGESLRRPNENR
jgi:DNA replication protein DnaC